MGDQLLDHIVIGNAAERLGDDSFNWTLYVRGDATSIVEEVVVKLHPTFANPVQRLRGPVFELHRQGWGVFDIGITISFMGGGQLSATWKLQFSKPDSNTRVPLPSTVMALLMAEQEVSER